VTKLLSTAVLLAGMALATNASAATVMFGTFNLNVSPDLGPGSFGTIVVSDNGGGSALVTETITAPNFIINAGEHTPLTFNLAGGTIRANSVTAPYSVDVTPFTNPPFSNQIVFNGGIDGPGCEGGSPPGCGSVLSFIIDGFGGFNSGAFTFNNVVSQIFFASDISNVAGGVTGAVGATLVGEVQQLPIPAPIALFAAGLAGIGMLRRVTRRRRDLDAALS
jgi:hypothetical protein